MNNNKWITIGQNKKNIFLREGERLVVGRKFSVASSVTLFAPTVSSSQSAYLGSPPVFLGWSLDLLWTLWGQLKFWPGLILACTCIQSPQLPPKFTASNVGTLVCSDIPQMQCLPSQLWGFNLLLSAAHERSVPLQSHSPWSHSFGFVLSPPFVCCPPSPVPCPDRRWWKHRLSLFSQPGER